MPGQLTYPIKITDEPVIWRGDPFDWTLALAGGVDDSAGELVDPVDLTGFGTSWSSVARMGEQTVEWDVDATAAAAGFVVLRFSDAATASLVRGARYAFDVQATGGARSPFTVWTGRFTSDGDYTP